MRLIDADELWKTFTSADKDSAYDLVDVREMLNSLPTIEPNLVINPEEVTEGRVIEIGEDIIVMHHKDYYDMFLKSELYDDIEPCEDAISRAEAMSAIYECELIDGEMLDTIHLTEASQRLFAVRKVIPSRPSRPKGEWIPCEERLPNDGEWCLVSVNAIDDIPYEIVITDKVSYCYERGWVTAWMPLPEPWKGADDDSERD